MSGMQSWVMEEAEYLGLVLNAIQNDVQEYLSEVLSLQSTLINKRVECDLLHFDLMMEHDPSYLKFLEEAAQRQHDMAKLAISSGTEKAKILVNEMLKSD